MASRASTTLRDLAEGNVQWGKCFSDRMVVWDWKRDSGWGKPRIEPFGPLQLDPSCSVFHYGMEIFEGLKAYKSGGEVRLFRPQLNIARLNNSAERLALPTVDPNAMLHVIKDFVHEEREWVPESPGASLYIRPCLIATDAILGVRRSDTAKLIIIASPVASFFAKKPPNRARNDAESGPRGVRLLADPKYIRAWHGGVGWCKTGGNYAMSIAPTEEAIHQGYEQVLWLSDPHRRLVTEAGMMNIVFVLRDRISGTRKVVTPPLDGTILDGVTRRSVLELAIEMGIPVEERTISIDEVVAAIADLSLVEAFGTGTAAVICPIQSITVNGREAVIEGARGSEKSLSSIFRERLEKIYASPERHPWMVSVHPDQDVVAEGSAFLERENTGPATG